MQETKTAKLLAALKRRWITPDDAYRICGLRNSLSQRVGDFKKAGHKVVDEWVKDSAGRNTCKKYRILVKG